MTPGEAALRKAVARYAGLTGSPDESGAKRREQGLARAGNARVRRGMIQLAWRFLRFQKESALARWYQARTADSRAGTRKTMIVALARKLLIALWRFVTTGRHCRASSCVRHAEGLGEEHLLTYSALALAFSADCRLTIRGGGNRQWTWHRCRQREWARRPGASPPMRMTASWSGSERTYRIQVCGAKMRPNGELPSDQYA